MKKEKILQILAEGGGIEVYRNFIGKNENNNPEYLFFWSTNEKLISEGSNGIALTSKRKPIKHFIQLWNILLKKYPNLYELHLEYLHNDYKIEILYDLRKKILSKKININELYSLDSWLNNLNIMKYELTEKSPFENSKFLDLLNKFVSNSFNISTIYGWNKIENVIHSKFENISEYETFLIENNIIDCDGNNNNIENSGIYAYFDGENCLYIGKAKKLKNRLLNHFKSSQNIINKNNPKDGKRQRELFGYYKNEQLDIYYLEVDDIYSSQTGELLRKTFEGMLQLENKPEYDKKIDYTQQFV